MSKHTPGPWYVCGVPHYEFWITTDAPPHTGRKLKDRIAIVKAEGPAECPDFDGEAREANARLIAAAPEMLEALQLLQGQGWQVHDTEFGNEIRRRALAAIAKAEGKQ